MPDFPRTSYLAVSTALREAEAKSGLIRKVVASRTEAQADPRIGDLPNWLRLQGKTHPDMDPAEAEWCSMLNAAAIHIDRMRALLHDLIREPAPGKGIIER